MSIPRFELFKSSLNANFYFHLKAANEKITLASEGYVNKQSCLHGIESVRLNAPYDERYERRQHNDSYTFRLKAGNGQIIGRSESYTSAFSRDQGIESVKRDAPNAPVIDRT